MRAVYTGLQGRSPGGGGEGGERDRSRRIKRTFALMQANHRQRCRLTEVNSVGGGGSSRGVGGSPAPRQATASLPVPSPVRQEQEDNART